MEVKILTKENYQEAMELYCKCFNKEYKEITVPLLGDLFGLYIDNELIGIAQIDYINNLFENKKQAIINSFCIKEEYRHKGYGHTLLNKCIDFLLEKNINNINLKSNKNRIYAHMLYKKNNFEVIDTILLNKELN